MKADSEQLGAILKPKPKHKWFWSSYRNAEEFSGPFKTAGDAINEAVRTLTDWDELPEPVAVFYVSQGRRTTKAERDEWGVEFKWQCGDGGEIEIQMTAKP